MTPAKGGEVGQEHETGLAGRRGDGARRDREVHKIRLVQLPDLSDSEISRMVATGDIELMVRREDLADQANGGWGTRVAEFFEKVAAGVGATASHENRTIFVNIVGGAPERSP